MQRAIFVLDVSSERKDLGSVDDVGVRLAVDHFLNGTCVVGRVVEGRINLQARKDDFGR